MRTWTILNSLSGWLLIYMYVILIFYGVLTLRKSIQSIYLFVFG